MRSGSTRARSAAPARACWSRKAWRKNSTPRCGHAWRRCASARRSTSRPTSARSSRPSSWSASPRWSPRARQEGAEVFQPSISIPGTGTFFAPTLMTGVEPASTVAVVEIFGPVLVAMTFRTPDEAVALANNTRFGLAASIWSENINRSLEVAARLKAGVIWINATNLFDAAAGFGGYRESGFGREGGREGLYEYLTIDSAKAKGRAAAKVSLTAAPSPTAMAAAGRCRRPHGKALYRRQAGAAGFRLQLRRRQPGGKAGRARRPRQPQGHPQRGRGRSQGRKLGCGDRAQPRADPLLHRRESFGPRGRIRDAAAHHDRRVETRCGGGGRGLDPAHLLLCRLRRQI